MPVWLAPSCSYMARSWYIFITPSSRAGAFVFWHDTGSWLYLLPHMLHPRTHNPLLSFLFFVSSIATWFFHPSQPVQTLQVGSSGNNPPWSISIRPGCGCGVIWCCTSCTGDGGTSSCSCFTVTGDTSCCSCFSVTGDDGGAVWMTAGDVVKRNWRAEILVLVCIMMTLRVRWCRMLINIHTNRHRFDEHGLNYGFWDSGNAKIKMGSTKVLKCSKK